MSSTKFPAKFLSFSDVGRTIKITHGSGAALKDELVGIKVSTYRSYSQFNTEVIPERTVLVLFFRNENPGGPDARGIYVDPDSWVKRYDA